MASSNKGKKFYRYRPPELRHYITFDLEGTIYSITFKGGYFQGLRGIKVYRSKAMKAGVKSAYLEHTEVQVRSKTPHIFETIYFYTRSIWSHLYWGVQYKQLQKKSADSSK